MKPVHKLGLLLALVASFTLNSCASSTDPGDDNNNNNNNGGNGNTGQITVGTSYTTSRWTTAQDFEPIGEPTVTDVATIERVDGTYEGRSNVIVMNSQAQPQYKSYAVLEANGDMLLYAPIMGGPSGVLYSKWVRFPVSGSGETTVQIDTMLSVGPGVESRVTGHWKVRPIGTAQTTEAGKTWNVQLVQLDQITNWEFGGMTFTMDASSKYHFAKDMMMPVRSDIKVGMIQMGYENVTYQTVRLTAYDIK